MGKKGAILSMILLGGGFLIGMFMMIVINWMKTDEIKAQLIKEKEIKSLRENDNE